MPVNFTGEFDKGRPAIKLEKGKIMADDTVLSEDDLTSSGIEIRQGNSDLLANAVPNTPAWQEVIDGMNTPPVVVTALKIFMDHDGIMRMIGETFEVPSKIGDQWKHNGLVTVGAEVIGPNKRAIVNGPNKKK